MILIPEINNLKMYLKIIKSDVSTFEKIKLEFYPNFLKI